MVNETAENFGMLRAEGVEAESNEHGTMQVLVALRLVGFFE